MPHIAADFLYAACNLMSESQRHMLNFGNSGAIMRIRVTDSGSRNANQNLGWANLRNWNVRMFQSLSDVSELYRSHHQNSSLVTTPQ